MKERREEEVQLKKREVRLTIMSFNRFYFSLKYGFLNIRQQLDVN